MRHWLFHPLVFYPLALAFAALVVIVSLQPQAFPRAPTAVSGRLEGETLILDGAAFDAPEDPPEQHVTIVRDTLGQAQRLRLAVLPGSPDPRPDETGVFIRLDPAAAQRVSGRPLAVEVEYRPIVVTAASALAVKVEGVQPSQWVSQPIPPLSGVARFTLPAAQDARGIGLRAVSGEGGFAYGVEIVAIRVTPLAS